MLGPTITTQPKTLQTAKNQVRSGLHTQLSHPTRESLPDCYSRSTTPRTSTGICQTVIVIWSKTLPLFNIIQFYFAASWNSGKKPSHQVESDFFCCAHRGMSPIISSLFQYENHSKTNISQVWQCKFNPSEDGKDVLRKSRLEISAERLKLDVQSGNCGQNVVWIAGKYMMGRAPKQSEYFPGKASRFL
ncbi:hypothetical protein M427DRAFT_46839 [Gonapodya prolifera JEL478]|uniref:Uncharacterized protein n=1 Tax=Gonapodya prolifera (strain JEL478) TaxID=1344416 RepID=A0A139A4U1_GONPJ|nr:hypothetical protein M427DRAFT_46839 [Gonapodya prolifera JEL478]|eukprot:KXS11827.1 hypothetical protein M427DRAFT_46839 [Gonapodya prolifera JEL478]